MQCSLPIFEPEPLFSPDIKLKKHSALIQLSGNTLGIVQKKAFLGLLYYARAQKTTRPDRHTFQIPYSQLKTLCGITSPNNKELHSQLEGLIGTVVRANVLNKDKKNKWNAFTLISSARELDKGILEFSLPMQIEESLLSPSMYSLVDFDSIRRITNKYALSLYELCFDYKKYGVPEMSIPELRMIAGVPDGVYPSFKELNKFVIQKSICEIKNKTKGKMQIKADFKKEGRTVVSVKFTTLYKESEKVLKEDSILNERELKALESISAGKGAGYHATLVNKMLLGDEATMIAIQQFIKDEDQKQNSDICSEIIMMINEAFIGKSLQFNRSNVSSIFTISGASQVEKGYLIHGSYSDRIEDIFLNSEQLIKYFNPLLSQFKNI